MRYTDIDKRIEALADRQHGVFTRQQAFQLGASETFVQRRHKEGIWVRPVAGVYALARSPGTWLRQCKIAELSVGASAVAGRTAAALHGLTGFRPGPIELLVPANASCRHPWAQLHRFAGAKLTNVDGICTTTIGQTLFDVADSVGLWKLERALDDAILTKRVTVDELDERLQFYVGSRRNGLPRIRSLVGERLAVGWAPPESELEAVLAAVLRRLPSRPVIVRQAVVAWRGARLGRVDFLLPEHRLIIEADGRRWHARAADFDNDRWRDNQATAHQHRVLRFTWVHLNQLADEVIELIERTIAPSAEAA